MITKIGITAGDIWNYLDHKGRVSLEELLEHTQVSRDLLMMSLGWLAREGHVLVDSENGQHFAQLR